MPEAPPISKSGGKFALVAKVLLWLVLAFLLIPFAVVVLSLTIWALSPSEIGAAIIVTLVGLIGAVAGIRLAVTGIRERRQKSP
ncbi:MAG: hypothetical protein WCA56_11610 [Xanthobacteraceae bacterium]